MSERRNKKYFFSVEGETELLYFQHLKNLIVSEENRIVNPVIRVEKLPPSKFAKKLPLIRPCTITAVYDVEDNDEEHRIHFKNILKEMKASEKLGKAIKYKLAYSNIDFELWILLHKKDMFGTINSRSQYLTNINSVFGTKFQGLKEYKVERNFNQILSQISLEDVKAAINRAEKIITQRKSEDKPLKFFGYEWYERNPSLSIHSAIKEILIECGV
ncbi:MAG: RloB domain-containing protein [Spirochaetaceae bacterium]|nr:RloB domain-containing protein [Spirochaetaceae bacterium]